MSKKDRPRAGQSRTPTAANAHPAAAELPAFLSGRAWLPPLLLALFTALLWARLLRAPLQYWDDNVYIFEDPRLDHFTLENLKAIFTKSFFANYHPIATLTYATDRAVWDVWLPGYYITHLAFYVAGVVLVYFFFRRALGSVSAAFFAGALYAAHAIHAEPVAWLASRKDVVCLVFYAAALILYARYAAGREEHAQGRGPPPLWSFLAALLATLLAMGSKGYAAVLPFAFVAWDLCYARRFRWAQVFDKAPFVALAVGLAVVTFLSQDETSALLKDSDHAEAVPPWVRMVILLKVFALYVGRALLPVRLCSQYMVRVEGGWPAWVAVAGALCAAGMVAGFFLLRRRRPAVAFGFALFLLPLATTMNTFFTLRVWLTDRYMFFPTIGSCLVLGALGLSGVRKGAASSRRRALPAAALLLVALYAALTFARLRFWLDPVLLWSDVLRKNYPEFAGEGRVSAAEAKRALSGQNFSSTLIGPLTSLSGAYDREGNKKEADAVLEVLKPLNFGGTAGASADIEAGRYDDAIRQLLPVLEKGEWFAPLAAKLLGDAYAHKGDPERARAYYRKSQELHRQHKMTLRDPLMGEGAMEYYLKNYARAVEIYRQLRQEAPNDPRGGFYEGRALEELGRLDEALQCYEDALALGPEKMRMAKMDPADIHRQAGHTAGKLGRNETAARHYEEYLRLRPQEPERAYVEKLIKELRQKSSARGQ